MGSPSPGGAVTLNTRELADIVESEVDHIAVDELANWITQDRADYRLIDVRDPESYATYHIPTAELVELRDLNDYPLYHNEKIVLYSDGGIHSAQAWFLLRAKGFAGAYILLGGLDAWKDEILFPELPADATPVEVASFERRRTVSELFGGKPRTDGSTAQPSEVVLPKVEPPAPVAAPHTSKKHHKEGC
jgi:rhodanese-related sulfurtransferase